MAGWTAARTSERETEVGTQTGNAAPQRAPEPMADARWGNAAAAEELGLAPSPVETAGADHLGPQPDWANDEGLDDEPASPEKQLALARRDAYVRAAARELLASVQSDYAEAVRTHVAAILANPYTRRGGGGIQMSSRAFRDQLLTSAELCAALGLPRAGTAFLVLDVSRITAAFSDVTDSVASTSATVTLDGMVQLSLSGGSGPGVSWKEIVGSDPFSMAVWPTGFVTGTPAEVRFREQ